MAGAYDNSIHQWRVIVVFVIDCACVLTLDESAGKLYTIRACSYYCINYHCKQDKASKDNVEFVVASENPPEPFDSPKESFNLISTSVEFLIIFPWITAVLLWGNNRMITKLHGHSSHVVALISAIHEK